MKSRSLLLPVLLGGAILATALLPRESSAQAGADDPLLTPVITELGKQQDLIVANQVKIDEKLATIAENVRVARIFVSRGGGRGSAK